MSANTYNFYFSFFFVYKFYCLKIIKNEFIKGNKIFKDSKKKKNNNKNKLLNKMDTIKVKLRKFLKIWFLILTL